MVDTQTTHSLWDSQLEVLKNVILSFLRHDALINSSETIYAVTQKDINYLVS